MEILKSKEEMRAWTRRVKRAGENVGFVPTMGFLHEGHLSLVQEAKRRADKIVVSVYVNPSQFAVGEDLDTYPRDVDTDLVKLRSLNVDAVFLPENLYRYNSLHPQAEHPQQVATHITSQPTDVCGLGDTVSHHDHDVMRRVVEKEGGGHACSAGEVEGSTGGGKSSAMPCLEAGSGAAGSESEHETWVTVERLQQPLCGRSRPVFFRGVATVVTKLFHIVEPDVAVFGKKDYQQWRLIRHMVRDLDMAVDVVGAPLVREADGLAMSSRNVRLSPEERQRALSISRSLKDALQAYIMGEVSCSKLTGEVRGSILAAGGRVDYVECVDQETLLPLARVDRPAVIAVAAWFGSVRLLDNVELGSDQAVGCTDDTQA